EEAIKHFLQAFASLGICQKIKTDNGLAYASKNIKNFFNQWRITHVTSIPHSSTCQAIIERTHKC
ncbi:POK11 protein, partial [Thryothorus ludovicianus]|nr:POK11 protein [Thryothorus ludovicianus]